MVVYSVTVVKIIEAVCWTEDALGELTAPVEDGATAVKSVTVVNTTPGTALEAVLEASIGAALEPALELLVTLEPPVLRGLYASPVPISGHLGKKAAPKTPFAAIRIAIARWGCIFCRKRRYYFGFDYKACRCFEDK